MKHITFLFLVLLLSYDNSAQCPSRSSGDLRFSSQNQIDSFIVRWPDCQLLKNAIIIEQDTSKQSQTITNLAGLSRIVSIQGDLVIRNCDSLKAFDDMRFLKVVLGDVVFSNNPHLSDVSSIVRPTCNTLTIEKCPNLKSLDFHFGVFAQEVKITGPNKVEYLTLSGNHGNLGVTIENLDHLRKVTFSNNSYTNIIIRNSALDSIQVLNNGPQKVKNFIVTNCTELSHIDTFSNLRIVEESFHFDASRNLNLDWLPNLISANSFILSNSESISSLNPLRSLEVNQFLIVGQCPNLVDISGLATTVDVSENIWLINNPRLDECSILCSRITKGQLTRVDQNDVNCSDIHEIRERCIINSNEKSLFELDITRRPDGLYIQNNEHVISYQLLSITGQCISEGILLLGDHFIKVPLGQRGVLYLQKDNESSWIKI